MLLAVDVGNTNTVLGLFKGKKLIKTWRIESSKTSLLRWARANRLSLDGAVVSSVVPPLRKTLLGLTRRYQVPSGRVTFVGPHLKMPIRIKVKNPKEVGADRIMNAVEAYAKYNRGARQAAPLLVIDFGTATTFDVVTAKGEFLGGAIVPGLKISAEALSQRCARLPMVPLKRPRSVIGRTTHEAIRSGVFLGYLSLVEGMIARFKKKLGPRLKVIATGGLAPVIARECRSINRVNSVLTLEGLRLLYEWNRRFQGVRIRSPAIG